MRRYILATALLVAALFLASAVSWARGAGSQNAGQVEGTVRDVFRAQGLVTLTNGASFARPTPASSIKSRKA